MDPSPEQPDPVTPTAESPPPARHGRWITPTLRGLAVVAILVAGVVIGIAADLVRGITGSWQVFVPATVFGVAVSVVFLFVLFILHRRAKARFEAGAGEAFDKFKNLGRALALRGREADGDDGDPPPDLEAALESAFAAAPNAFTYWVTGRAYWRLFLAIGSLIGAAVLVSQFIVLTEQTQRLTDQNQLIQLEVQLAAITRQADLEQQQAARAYDEITRILDENTSAGAIVNALERLPEAMVMPVTVVDSRWSPTPGDAAIGTQTVYPNLRPLAARLLSFAKIERPAQEATWDSNEIGSVSTAICHTLHRLGFGNQPQALEGACVWHAIYDSDGVLQIDANERLNRLRGTGRAVQLLISQPRLGRYDLNSFEFAESVDLRHIREWQLHGAQFQRASLSRANMQRLDLHDTDFESAYLDDVNLQSAILTWANLQNATLSGANLQFAQMMHSSLRSAELDYARLQNADLYSSRMIDANLTGARLYEASLKDVRLQVATLIGAELQGADLTDADLRGADLSGAELQGANLVGAKIQSTNFTKAHLAAERIAVILSVNTREWWRSDEHIDRAIQQGVPVVEVDVPAASLDNASFGTGVFRARKALEPYRRHVREHPTAEMWWEDRAEAEEYLREELGEDADIAISELVERPTEFGGSLLDGVLIAKSTFEYLSPIATSPTANEAFANANTSLFEIRERTSKPYRFPFWGQLLKLAQDQTAKREEQASGAESQPQSQP